MNPQIKKLWVDALRSGRYQQTKNLLHRVKKDEHSYCCLGVLCEVVKKDLKLRIEPHLDMVKYNGHASILPPQVASLAGITEDQAVELSTLNDEGSNFNQIADKVEIL